MRRKAMACIQILRFSEAIYCIKGALEIDRADITVKNELEEAEHLGSNYEHYLSAVEKNDYHDGLSCINLLV